MKIPFKQLLLAAGLFTTLLTSCAKKNDVKPGDNGGNGNIETHIVDAKLIGTWLLTDSGDGGVWDSNGTYQGSEYGLARQFTINADGTGTCFDHMYSFLNANVGIEVNIKSNGFFESDNDGHLGYFPLAGTYDSSGGDHHVLSGTEIYNPTTKQGNVILMQKVTFTTVGNKQAFEVTSSDGITDTFVKQ